MPRAQPVSLPARRLLAVVLLALVAVGATLRSPTIFFDNQILLGPSLGVFALLQYGWLGLPVGVASALGTVTLWGHPWAALVLVLQLLWQQLFLSRFNGGREQRGNGRIVLATIGFWLLLGLPLKTLLYVGLLQADLSSALVLGFKEAVVGVVNASLALLLYLALQLLQLRRQHRGDLSLRGLIFTALLLLISLPGVLIITVMGQQITEQAITQFRLALEQQAEVVAFELPAGSGSIAAEASFRRRFEGLAFEALGADGRRLSSDPALFSRLEQAYRPELESLLGRQGLTLLVPAGASSVLQRHQQGYWRYGLNLPTSAASVWRQITVVQPSRRHIELLITMMRPSLLILGLLLIAAALISEAVTTVLSAQFNRIVGSLAPLGAAADPAALGRLGMPELQLTRLRELNRIVDLINHQGRIVNQLSTELQQSNEQLHQRATIDDLTGLLNRRALLEQLQALLAHPDRRRGGEGLALLFCDLDRFKEINDTLGHVAGDLVLRTVAERIRYRLRGADLAARMGGDELVVVLPSVPDLETAMAIAESLSEAIGEAITTAELHMRITASIGVTLARPGESVDALIARADVAMYEAKQAGRNRVTRID